MGSIANAINSITGADADMQRVKERMELVLVAAKGKLRAYRDEMNEMFLNPASVERIQIPGIRAMRFIEQYHVASKESLNQQCSDHLDAAIDAFFAIGGKDVDNKQKVKDGVHALISTALAGFIGTTEAGESEEKIYVVIPENNAFVRVDVALWKYHLESEKFLAESDTAVAYILCKSVIDHSKLTIDELIYLSTEAMSKRTVVSAPKEATQKAFDAWKQANTDLKETNALVPLSDDLKKALGQDKQYTVFQYASKETEAATKYTFKAQLLPVDAQLAGLSDPASLDQVSEYIGEMIRVWNKLKEERT